MRRALLPLLLFLLPFSVAGQSTAGFSDSDLQKVLRENSRVLFYSVSPAMPLSIEGLEEIRGAAEDLDAQLVLLVDPAATEKEIAAIGKAGLRVQKSSDLRSRGLQLHYPSLLVADNHKMVGNVIGGHKTREAYVSLVSDRLKLRWEEEFRVGGTVSLPRRMNAFFKPVYGTNFIVSGSAAPNYLFNLGTGESFNTPSTGWGDPGASKDGEFVTLLGGIGLRWFSTADILAGKPSVLFDDPGLRTYQSMGQLDSGVHRVLGAVTSSTNPAGLIIRDYQKRDRPDGGATISPLQEWRSVCDGKIIAIPMLSKTGLYLSGTFNGTTRVFRIGPNASECVEVFDSGVVSGKADFSVDDRYIVYVSRAEQPNKRVQVDAVFLADLQDRSVQPIFYAGPDTQLAFPAFMTADRVVVFDQTASQLIVLDRTRRILE